MPVGVKCLLLFSVLLLLGISRVISSTSLLESSPSAVTLREKQQDKMVSPIQIVFSDVDGTLVHYPEIVDDNSMHPQANDIIRLPPSVTGQRGIISSETLRKCRTLRRGGKKFVLVSGMRSTTLWNRIPYLPRADAYCSEAGGRIFYPVPVDENRGRVFVPEPFEGANQSDLEPFSLIEDKEWRLKMEATAGVEGFLENELELISSTFVIPVSERKGVLWAFCRELQRKGFVVDTKGYSVCFRVNRNQQVPLSQNSFETLNSVEPPTGLATSINLGCVDFYPHDSGKKNCCEYLAKKLCTKETELQHNAICLCDDDNDLEMALACRQAFVPGISSSTMARIVEENRGKIVVTGGIDDLEEGTSATERALDKILELVN